MRSIVGVGITPPKVLGTPKPESSVMISRMLGAFLGGTTRGYRLFMAWLLLAFAAILLLSELNLAPGTVADPTAEVRREGSTRRGSRGAAHAATPRRSAL